MLHFAVPDLTFLLEFLIFTYMASIVIYYIHDISFQAQLYLGVCGVLSDLFVLKSHNIFTLMFTQST